jgi:hypothetical protein
MRACWTTTRARILLGAATGYIALVGLVAMLGGSAHAGVALEERKLPMKFNWVVCQPNCWGWVSAAGTVTAEVTEPRDVTRVFKLISAPWTRARFSDVIGLALRFDALTIPA